MDLYEVTLQPSSTRLTIGTAFESRVGLNSCPNTGGIEAVGPFRLICLRQPHSIITRPAMHVQLHLMQERGELSDRDGVGYKVASTIGVRCVVIMTSLHNLEDGKFVLRLENGSSNHQSRSRS